jgi:serine/threonine protein kinase
MIELNRWKDISRLYHEARRRPEDARQAFLRQACDGDEQLGTEVESLLASDADAGDDFLASPAATELIATLGAEMESLVGRQVASYRIDALLGVGGMGEVYRATDTRLNRPVALKILPQHLHEVPHVRERFEREARAVAALRHPHICVLYDIGEDKGIAFLVMELLEGETLAVRLTAGPLEREELFRCAIDISDALAETHRQGVVHGDLKPGNVMLTREGAKLLDFGLATMSPSTTAAAVSIGEGRFALTTTIGGTLPYMAPEQLEGRATDWRADVFAFGAILYEMVTARKAFDGRTVPGPPMDGVVDQPVPLSPDAPRWARDLAPLINRCLARNPDDRWARTLDVADELRRISISSNELPQQEPQLAERRLTRGWVRFVAVATVSIASFWWAADRWNWPVGQPISSSAVATVAPLTLGNMRPVTADDRLEVDPTLSPDGRLIAYAAGTATGMRVFVRSVSEGPTRQLTDTPDALEYHPRWSPDGREILYVTPTGAFVVPASGGLARRVDSQADTAGSYSATTPNTARRIFSSAIWSPDGRRLAIAYGGSLSIVPADGVGERRRIGSSPYELH